MGLLEGKSHLAQEFYNEYLQLKESLLFLTNGQLEYYKKHSMNGVVENIETQIEEKSERLKYVLEQLRLEGVTMESLVLLSCGIDQ